MAPPAKPRTRNVRLIGACCVGVAALLGSAAALMTLRTSGAGASQPVAVGRTMPSELGATASPKANGIQAPTAAHTTALVEKAQTTPEATQEADPKAATADLDADVDADAPGAKAAPAPSNAAAPSNASGAGQRSAPGCDELMKAHRSPPKKSELDYEYLHQLRTARRELVRGNLDAAHAAFCRATLDPGADVNVWTEFAQLLVLRRDGVAAVPWAERALAVEPKNVRARGLLGDALMLAGRTEDARRAWLLAVNETEADAAAIDRLVKRNLGEAQRALKSSDPARAERFFRRVLAFDEQNAKALEGLAAVQAQLGTSI